MLFRISFIYIYSQRFLERTRTNTCTGILIGFRHQCTELHFCIFLFRFVQDWFSERTQVAKVDFSTVLPRFISLYIFSFLNPKDLCAAAQVSWPWKFLTEQVYYLSLLCNRAQIPLYSVIRQLRDLPSLKIITEGI